MLPLQLELRPIHLLICHLYSQSIPRDPLDFRQNKNTFSSYFVYSLYYHALCHAGANWSYRLGNEGQRRVDTNASLPKAAYIIIISRPYTKHCACNHPHYVFASGLFTAPTHPPKGSRRQFINTNKLLYLDILQVGSRKMTIRFQHGYICYELTARVSASKSGEGDV